MEGIGQGGKKSDNEGWAKRGKEREEKGENKIYRGIKERERLTNTLIPLNLPSVIGGRYVGAGLVGNIGVWMPPIGCCVCPESTMLIIY